MPTADPFDPTDGRENDVIYLYPSEEKCPPVMNIHRRLLDLHETTIDLRWLEWLEEETGRRPEAKTLMRQIKKSIPDDWEDASLLSAQELLEIRRKIMELTEKKIRR